MFNKKYIHISQSHTIYIYHAMYHTIIQYTLNTVQKSGWCYMWTDQSYKNRCLIFFQKFSQVARKFIKKFVFLKFSWNFASDQIDLCISKQNFLFSHFFTQKCILHFDFFFWNPGLWNALWIATWVQNPKNRTFFKS